MKLWMLAILIVCAIHYCRYRMRKDRQERKIIIQRSTRIDKEG